MKKRCKRTIAAVAAFVIAMQGAAVLPQAYAARPLVSTLADSSSQMNSQPEVVYVSRYGQSKQRTESFVNNWKFYLGEATGAEKTTYNDASWRQLDLPHDYSIEQEFSQALEAESGYLPGGVGWYRKNFTVDPSQQGKRIRVDFDGVYMDATVWVNGEQLATHPYGYSPFSVDITDQVNFGEDNLIAVKVNHQTPSSRWYSGSGIYRDVNLTITDPVHVDLGGTQITTPNLETQAKGNVDMTIATTVVNDGTAAANVSVTHTLYEKGKDVAKGTVTVAADGIAAHGNKKVTATLKTTEAPKLWDTEHPNLYTVRTEIKQGEKVLDSYDTTYGFRYFKFDTKTGFSLNGENMKLKGVCMHHDQGALGAVNNRRAVERQVEILMDMGCNSIRVTHNPASQNLIDICNEKGVLVVEEIFDGWMYPKNSNRNDFARFFNKTMDANSKLCHADAKKTWAQYSLQETLLRDRNAPSVIMWSLGNEIQEGTNIFHGYSEKVPDLIKWAQEIDTSNLLTIGSNEVKNEAQKNNKNGTHSQIANKITAVGGVSGTNYSNGASYDKIHSLYPDWKVYGSETASSVNSRGIYNRTHDRDKTTDKQLTSYDNSTVIWGALANDAWRDVIERDFVAGEYVWTGFDYIGEPTHWNGVTGGEQGAWPSPKNSYFGIIDTAGFPKDSYYLYRSQWNTKDNTLHIMPAWNSQVVVGGGKTNVPVVVYASGADTVNLTLTPNDGSEPQVFTKKFVEKTSKGGGYKYNVAADKNNKLYVEFDVPYRDGTLKAESFKDGALVKTTEIKTAGKPAKLKMSVDTTERTVHADGKDLIYVTVDVTDAEGNLVPYAENRVHIKVDGPGELVGVDNGNSPDHDPYKGKSRKAFGGKMLAIVQTAKNAGKITITATADGLTSQSVQVTSTPVANNEQNVVLDGFYMAKSYYVKTGTIPTLPETIEARFSDGSKQNVNVAWDTITADKVEKAGSFIVKGNVRVNDVDYSVSVIVHVLENVGGMLNYSTTTRKDTKPALPAQRPVVMANGKILDVEFPVHWTIPEDSAFNTEDAVVVVNGTADVLGTTYPVTASVRVQKEIINIGDSASGAAHLSQDIPENQQSDTLDAIKNGSTTLDPNIGGKVNTSVWSNYKASNEFNDTTAEIIFSYDTQQSIGEAVIHFAKDTWSMRYPAANTTELWISDGGGEKWTKVDTTETIGTEKNNVTPYTYKFAPFTATQIKLKLTNTTQSTGTEAKPCTGITEVELKKAEGSFVTHHDAQLESLSINGHNVPQAQLNVAPEKKGTVAVNAAFADVAAAGKGNAAVTVLPAYENIIHIITEAEDHTARSYFDIELNKEASFPADDDSRDYPKETTTGIAGSQLNPASGGEGPASFVTDGDPQTHWHTNWKISGDAAKESKRWVGLDMGKEKPIVGVRVLPRQQGNGNGATTEYRIEYSNDNQTWTPVPGATGTWKASDRGWKIVEFQQPVNAQYIRVVGVHTIADGNVRDTHMSMSELRALKPGDGDLTKCTIEVPATVKVDSVSKENPVMVNPVIKNGETTLSYGFDYTLSFTGNDAFGTATVTATGIGQYKGELSASFQIVKSGAPATSIAVKTNPTKTSYTAGETFDPAGLVLTVTYSDGTTAEVVYKKGDANFTFAPALDTKLTVDNKTVTVTYGEKSAEISITVATGAASLEEEIKLAEALNAAKYENDLQKVVFVSALRSAKSLPAGASEAARAEAAANLYQARMNLTPKA